MYQDEMRFAPNYYSSYPPGSSGPGSDGAGAGGAVGGATGGGRGGGGGGGFARGPKGELGPRVTAVPTKLLQ